ncbi:MAG: TetR/AcrR family transcriptional regulator [Leptospiraceae bacterium]|nr:TetR/AcrR family transcriptional regulator [Leptospiraceae bacterium]MCB1318883.1 TetR/AcrR family transcriptional regulator [Leptospiraceae bacterium]
MPRIVNTEEQRRRILAAAMQVIAREGFAGTGLQQVARAAGLSRPGIYTYYNNRESLLDDLVESICDEEMRLFAACLSANTGVVRRFENLARMLADAFYEMGPTGAIMIQLWAYSPERMAELLRNIRSLSEKAIRKELREKKQPGANATARMMAVQITAALDGILLQYLLEPNLFKTKVDLSTALVSTVNAIMRPALAR